MNALDELSVDDLRAALEHAERCAQEKPTSPEYREWWAGRASALRQRLAAKTGNRVCGACEGTGKHYAPTMPIGDCPACEGTGYAAG